MDGLAQAYRRLGCDVVVGTHNFTLRTADFDLVHLQWPEELSGWRPPSPETLDLLCASLDYWTTHSRVLATVHNLYPHGYEGDPRYVEMFDRFYGRATIVHHFSRTSSDLVRAAFPSSRDNRHMVTTLFNYDYLLPPEQDRSGARAELGLADDEVVFLIFGALRMWKEVELIQSAWKLAPTRRKRLLMAGRYNEVHSGSRIGKRIRRWRWDSWLRRQNAVVVRGYVPDNRVHRLFAAADVAVIPRVEGLSSGMPSMAMTFGKLFVAPDHGAFPEYVGATGNLLYESCNPASLARAIDASASLDRDRIGEQNREASGSWSWDGIAAQFLQESLLKSN